MQSLCSRKITVCSRSRQKDQRGQGRATAEATVPHKRSQVLGKYSKYHFKCTDELPRKLKVLKGPETIEEVESQLDGLGVRAFNAWKVTEIEVLASWEVGNEERLLVEQGLWGADPPCSTEGWVEGHFLCTQGGNNRACYSVQALLKENNYLKVNAKDLLSHRFGVQIYTTHISPEPSN